MRDRCPECGTRQRPNPLPWLLLPVLLGGAAAAFLLLWGERFGLGGSILIVTLPFAAFLLALKQATAAWTSIDPARCRHCGTSLADRDEPEGPGRP